MTVVSTELVYVKCANQACTQKIAFVKGSFALPQKTYCEFCCNDISAPINDTVLDQRYKAFPLLDPLPKV